MQLNEILISGVCLILIVIVTRVFFVFVGFGSIGISLGVAMSVAVAIAIGLVQKRTNNPPPYFKMYITTMVAVSTLLAAGVLLILPGNLVTSISGLAIAASLNVVISPLLCSFFWAEQDR
ncbi:MAG: hypothetical protein AAF564_14250 [Bacteroidota bacterium]